MGSLGRTWTFVTSTPCLVLLAVQLGGVVLYPFLDERYAGRAVFSVFGFVVLGLTISALRATPLLTWVAGLVAAPAAVLLLVSAFTGDPQLFAWSAGFELVTYFYASVSMLFYMLGDGRRDHRRAVPHSRDIHPAGLGVRLPLHRRAGPRPW